MIFEVIICLLIFALIGFEYYKMRKIEQSIKSQNEKIIERLNIISMGLD